MGNLPSLDGDIRIYSRHDDAVPGHAAANYIVLREIGLLDTLWALLLPSIFAPLGVFLMTQFLREMPMNEIRAARIDKATLPRFIARIVLPRAWPGLAACVLLAFAEAWNMVEQPLVLSMALKSASILYMSLQFSNAFCNQPFQIICF